MDLGKASALETASSVRSGTLSALEVCDAAIARIEAMDGPINAVPVRDFERARAAARALDAAGLAGDPRPLIGVAMTLKESNDMAGLPSTWGIEAHRDHIPADDAVVTARLRAAGAIIVGKTNAPVGLADWQSDNPIYGRTVNPLDHSRSPGGSSGGAAAALAAGMVPLEIGSDIGGSIRVPAHFCGVFGHKPTYGLVPGKGHGFPGTDGLDPPLAVVGPMARSAADLRATLQVIAGPLTAGLRLDLPPGPRTIAGLRIHVLHDHPRAVMDRATAAALTALEAVLADQGARIVPELALPDLEQMHRAYVKMLNTVLQRGTPEARPIDAHAWMDLTDEQMRITRAWSAAFETVDLVIAPVFGTAAFPLMDEPDWRKRELMIDGRPTPFGDQLVWPGLATFPGLPATAIPVARDGDGLPIAVQAIGVPWADLTTIGLAELLQAAGLTL